MLLDVCILRYVAFGADIDIFLFYNYQFQELSIFCCTEGEYVSRMEYDINIIIETIRISCIGILQVGINDIVIAIINPINIYLIALFESSNLSSICIYIYIP